MLLRALASGEKSVGELVQVTSFSQPNISNHLARLHHHGVVRRRREVRKIYYSLADQRVRTFISGPSSRPSSPDLADVYEHYVEAIYRWNMGTAESLIFCALAAGAPWQQVYLEVLMPALRQVGDEWAEGGITVAQEHAVSALTERLMSRICPNGQHPSPIDPDAPRAVVGCAPGELHSITTRMAADFLEDAGWRTVFLGADVPREDFVRAVRQHRARLALLSVMMEGRTPAALGVLKCLRAHAASQPLLLLVGGSEPCREPELYLAAGADAIAQDPRDAALLAGKWIKRKSASDEVAGL